MNPLLIITLAALAVALCAGLFLLALHNYNHLRPGECFAANIAEGVHLDSVTRYADAAITTRFLLYKVGSDSNHIAVAGVDDPVIGIVADEVATADISAIPVAVQLLGHGTTKRMVASEAMATAGVDVFQAASGKIALSGTRKRGVLLGTASADGDVVEVLDAGPTDALGVVPTENVTATNVITAAESGKTFFLNSATEFVSTLPAPAAGLRFTFIVVAAPSGASYTVVTTSSANIIKGNQNSVAGDAGDFGTADDTISFVDGQSVAGDKVEVISDGTSWFAYAISKVAAGITFTQAS